jgi:hypothetical protein
MNDIVYIVHMKISDVAILDMRMSKVPIISGYDFKVFTSINLVRDSSAVWRLIWTCCSRGTSESYTYGKQRSCLTNSWSAHFHVLWLSDFIFYQKPLYKSLHQSFFYSTILPSESGVRYTPLQHDFALDPIIPPFDFHFRIYKRDLAILTEWWQ